MSRSPADRAGTELESAPGVNGCAARAQPPPPAPGGRLKFYQDGKVVLELATARTGDRTAWVSVPRKAYWAPPAPHPPASDSNSHSGRPRRASLSVSDDNSSVQSSPWQRDHCWKQAAPKRGASKELQGLYLRPAELPASLLTTATARRKRRRPFDAAEVPPPPEALRNGAGPHQRRRPKVYTKTRRAKRRRGLGEIVRALADGPPARAVQRPAPEQRPPKACLVVNAKTSLVDCRDGVARAMVSPRKRILREFEREELEDSAKKGRPRQPTASGAPKPGPSRRDSSPKPSSRESTPPSRPRAVSSYSIHSLLSKPERKSAPVYGCVPPPSDSPIVVRSPDPASSPEAERRSRVSSEQYASRSFESPGRSAREKRYREAYAVCEEQQAPLSWYQSPPYAPSPVYFGAGYQQYGPHAHHPFLVPYPMLPPGPWGPVSAPLLADRIPGEEASSDLPLNLSKH